jgi:transcriptional regulator of met regulon
MGLTEELRAILTDEHVRTLMNNARGSAAEINELAVNDFLSVFSTGPMHYEAVLGYLQIQSRRKRELLQDYAALAGWLTETVYLRLFDLRAEIFVG